MYWFVGDDRRAFWTVEFLRERGLEVHVREAPEQIPVLLLPFPTALGKEEWEALLPKVNDKSLVIGAKLGPFGERLEQTGAKVYDLYGAEPLTTLNAALTAEGALALAIEASEGSLWESRCLVIGAGRIGMALAHRLKALGARVSVSARSPKDLALIRSLGLEGGITGDYDFVFNTVPAPVLTESQLSRLQKSCVLLELASAPGGFSFPACKALGLTAIMASGLPGRFSPKTAGRLYGECILEVLEKEGRL